MTTDNPFADTVEATVRMHETLADVGTTLDNLARVLRRVRLEMGCLDPEAVRVLAPHLQPLIVPLHRVKTLAMETASGSMAAFAAEAHELRLILARAVARAKGTAAAG